MNLANKVSAEDRQTVNSMRNHPDFESGFEQDAGGNMDDLLGGSSNDDLGDLNSLFGMDDSSGGDLFGSSSGMDSMGGMGNNNSMGGFGTFGGGDPFSNPSGGLLGTQQNNNPFLVNNQQAQQQPQQDTFDKVSEGFVESIKAAVELLKEFVGSAKLRSADDFGYLGRNMILVGGGMLGGGILSGIIGLAANIRFLSFSSLATQLILCGGLGIGLGLTSMGTAAFVLTKFGAKDSSTPNNLDDIPSGEDNFTSEYEDHNGDILDDLFGDDFDMSVSDDEEDELFGLDTTGNSEDDDLFGDTSMLDDIEPEPIDFEAELAKIRENKVISRQTLFETFKPMLPTNTPKFADVSNIDEGTDDFESLDTICMRALANLANCQLNEIQSHLETAKETMFSYELRVKRINKVKKTEELAREIEVYMRDSSDDDSVNATVSIEGDFYKIIVTKGTTAVVTFGDIFRKDYCSEFFLNDKKKLPMITGINELGEVILDDAKNFDTILIAGKPRSGKSWYVLSILMALMLFNPPEWVQFLIIDPKKSNLFKTMSLMPHVFGLHDDSNILKVLDDVIEVEAPRRKDMLASERCDDIWALRDKGIMLPILYIVIDEYITVINNLDKDQQKEFDTKFQVIISQLPSLGIRLLFVPHRATGIVNKTNRTMIQYTAAVRADIEDVKDTLGIAKWDRALTRPGDTAVKNANIKNAVYVRGAALTTSDGENSKFIEAAAGAFYKMGVDIPDMSNMRVAYNRNEEWVQNELKGTGKRIQFDAQSLSSEAEDVDLSTAF